MAFNCGHWGMLNAFEQICDVHMQCDLLGIFILNKCTLIDGWEKNSYGNTNSLKTIVIIYMRSDENMD